MDKFIETTRKLLEYEKQAEEEETSDEKKSLVIIIINNHPLIASNNIHLRNHKNTNSLPFPKIKNL